MFKSSNHGNICSLWIFTNQKILNNKKYDILMEFINLEIKKDMILFHYWSNKNKDILPLISLNEA